MSEKKRCQLISFQLPRVTPVTIGHAVKNGLSDNVFKVLELSMSKDVLLKNPTGQQSIPSTSTSQNQLLYILNLSAKKCITDT